MATPKRNVRGLQDIRTLSGSVDQKSVPHRAYMRITVLEMEKARRAKERESAMHRVKNIDARFQEIDAEKDELLRVLGERKNAGPANGANTEAKPGSERDRSERGLRIRY